jgi:hypothetical protein
MQYRMALTISDGDPTEVGLNQQLRYSSLTQVKLAGRPIQTSADVPTRHMHLVPLAARHGTRAFGLVSPLSKFGVGTGERSRRRFPAIGQVHRANDRTAMVTFEAAND